MKGQPPWVLPARVMGRITLVVPRWLITLTQGSLPRQALVQTAHQCKAERLVSALRAVTHSVTQN
jgi:hypothetical protein